MNTHAFVVHNYEDNSFTILTEDERGWTAQRFSYEGRFRTYAIGPFPTYEKAFNAIIWTPDLERDSTRQGPHGARRSVETPPVDDPYETDMSQVNEDLTWMPNK